MSFTDKVVLVTGASRGIGRAIAEMFAARGAKVVGTATSESGAEAISAYLGEQGCGMALNVTSQESIETVFAAIKARFGNIDILIAAAVHFFTVALKFFTGAGHHGNDKHFCRIELINFSTVGFED